MIGAVFWLEMVRASRRGWLERLRFRYVLVVGAEAGLWLLLAFSLMNPLNGPKPPASRLGPLLELALAVLFWQQVAALLFSVPAFVAGSVTDEKTAGTLDHLLASPLSDWEIVAGKWAAAVVQVGTLVLPAVPIAALAAGLAGLPPVEACVLAFGPFVPLPAMAAGALLVSTLHRRTAPAILSFYGLLASSALLFRWMGWPAWWSLLAVLPLLLLATLALRRAHAVLGEARAVAGRGLPAIAGSAVRWKERVLGGRLPLIDRVPRWLWLAAIVGAATLPLLLPPTTRWNGVLQLAGLFALGSAVSVGIRAAVSVSGEREKGTWEALLTIPSPTEQLLRGKLWGLLDAALPYQLAYLSGIAPSAVLSGVGTVLGVASLWIASWMLIYGAAAVGLDCSTRSSGSWRAMVRALFDGAATGIWQPLAFSGVGAMLGGLAGGFLGLPATGAGMGGLAVFGLMLLVEAEARLERASQWVAQHERIPQGGERFLKPVEGDR